MKQNNRKRRTVRSTAATKRGPSTKWKPNEMKIVRSEKETKEKQWAPTGGARWAGPGVTATYRVDFFSFLFFSFLFLLLLLYFLGAFFSLSSLVVVALRPQNSVRSSLPIFFCGQPTITSLYLVFLPSFGCCWYLVFRNWDSLERALPRFNCSPVSTCLNVLLPRFTSFYPVLPSFT